MNCRRSYENPLTIGQYDIYECIVENVESDTVVSVEFNGTTATNAFTVEESASVRVEN